MNIWRKHYILYDISDDTYVNILMRCWGGLRTSMLCLFREDEIDGNIKALIYGDMK